jgi:ABC-type transporter Mla maintaining outer membrane lipid asymmetry ATPase subunit MlaF
MPSHALRAPQSGAGCDIELGRGLTYALTARTPADLDALLEQLLQLPGSHVADTFGGLVNNINVLENIELPALYHGLAPVAEVEHGILDAFAACGLDGGQAEALFSRRPGELSPYEKRLAGFVRSLVSRPDVLVYNRFFEGLTRVDMARAAALNSVYHARHPEGTAVYLMLSDMPDLQPECHRRIDLHG